MGELIAFLGGLSFGEFIIIWLLTILSVFFTLIILYYFVRIKKETHLLKIKVNRMVDLFQNKKDNI